METKRFDYLSEKYKKIFELYVNCQEGEILQMFIIMFINLFESRVELELFLSQFGIDNKKIFYVNAYRGGIIIPRIKFFLKTFSDGTYICMYLGLFGTTCKCTFYPASHVKGYCDIISVF